jgi:chromosome segregation ATPase
MAYDVKFLKGNGTSYEALGAANKLDINTFYYVDEKDLYLGAQKLTSDADVKSAVSRLELTEKSIQDIFAELEALSGGESGAGSISQQISTLRSELLAKIEANTAAIGAEETRAKAAEEKLTADLGDLAATVSANETDIEQKVAALDLKIGSNAGAIQSQGSTLADVSAKIAVLIGEDANKSARTIANEELAKQLIPGNAQDAMDTLEEIAAWIQQHPGDAASMNAEIQAAKAAVEALTPVVEEHGNSISGLQSAIAALGTTVAGHTSQLEAHETSLASILHETTGLLAQAKSYTDGSIEALDLGTASKKNVEDFDAAGSAAAALESARAYTDGALTWGAITAE